MCIPELVDVIFNSVICTIISLYRWTYRYTSHKFCQDVLFYLREQEPGYVISIMSRLFYRTSRRALEPTQQWRKVTPKHRGAGWPQHVQNSIIIVDSFGLDFFRCCITVQDFHKLKVIWPAYLVAHHAVKTCGICGCNCALEERMSVAIGKKAGRTTGLPSEAEM